MNTSLFYHPNEITKTERKLTACEFAKETLDAVSYSSEGFVEFNAARIDRIITAQSRLVGFLHGKGFLTTEEVETIYEDIY